MEQILTRHVVFGNAALTVHKNEMTFPVVQNVLDSATSNFVYLREQLEVFISSMYSSHF